MNEVSTLLCLVPISQLAFECIGMFYVLDNTFLHNAYGIVGWLSERVNKTWSIFCPNWYWYGCNVYAVWISRFIFINLLIQTRTNRKKCKTCFHFMQKLVTKQNLVKCIYILWNCESQKLRNLSIEVIVRSWHKIKSLRLYQPFFVAINEINARE